MKTFILLCFTFTAFLLICCTVLLMDGHHLLGASTLIVATVGGSLALKNITENAQ